MLKFLLFLLLIINNLALFLTEDKKIIYAKDIDNGAYIQIKANQNFTIELEGNLSTGFSWYLENPEKVEESGLIKATNLNKYNEGKYYKRSEIYKNEKSNKLVLGAPGLFHFDFIAKEKIGHLEIKLVYKRAWEDLDKIEKTFNIKIINENQNKKNDDKDL
jgi:predicted secreted protein